MTESLYKELGKERKALQAEGLLPDWVTTPSWQILNPKYLTEEEPDLHSTFWRIARNLPESLNDGKSG